MSFNTNQFSMSPVVGQPDLQSSISDAFLSCRYDPAGTLGTDKLAAGEGVLLKDLGADDSAGPPIIDERAADGNVIFGVRIFSTKQGYDNPGDICQIAMSGAVVWLNAGAAIARGASVALVLATPGNVVTRDAETVLGIALDKASGANVLIRVKIA